MQLLPPANEVWSKVMFLHMSVSNSVHGGLSLYDVTSCLGPGLKFLLGGLCLWSHVRSGGPISGFLRGGGAGVSVQGVSVWGVSVGRPLESEKWVVGIILECCLVRLLFSGYAIRVFTNVQNYQYWHQCQLHITIYLQCPSLFAPCSVST